MIAVILLGILMAAVLMHQYYSPNFDRERNERLRKVEKRECEAERKKQRDLVIREHVGKLCTDLLRKKVYEDPSNWKSYVREKGRTADEFEFRKEWAHYLLASYHLLEEVPSITEMKNEIIESFGSIDQKLLAQQTELARKDLEKTIKEWKPIFDELFGD